MKKVLVIMLVAISLFSMVSCSDKEEGATIFVSGNGGIYANFEEAQAVEQHKCLDGSSYYTCATADVSISLLESIDVLDDYINVFSLVSTDSSNKSFKVAITLDGFILKLVENFVAGFVGVLPEEITIEFTEVGVQFQYADGTPAGQPMTDPFYTLLVKLNLLGNMSPITINLRSFNIGLNLPPFYLSSDVIGVLSDFAARKVFKGFVPLFTTIGVYYKNGTPAGVATLEKIDVSSVVVNVDKTAKKTTFSNLENGVTYTLIGNANGFAIDSFTADNGSFTYGREVSASSSILVGRKSGCISGFCDVDKLVP